MGKNSARIAFIFLCFFGVYSKIPNYITPCSRHDKQCLIANFQSIANALTDTGDPSLNISPINKIEMKELAMQATRDLHVSVFGTVCKGLEATVMKEISMDNNELKISGFVPRLEFAGQYDMKGQLLIISLEGSGPLNVTFVGVPFDYYAKLKTENRRGKQYYYVDNNLNTRIAIRKVERAHYFFGNLFGGDPRLGPEINMFLNENWQAIFEETEGAFEIGLAFYVINPIINGFFRHIPISNLFVD